MNALYSSSSDSSYKTYLYIDTTTKEIKEKKLNCFQVFLRNFFGCYQETHLLKVADQFCQLDLNIVDKYAKIEAFLENKITLAYTAEKAKQIFARLMLKRQHGYVESPIKCPIGIHNGKNNCYAISTMQALLASPLLAKKIENLAIEDRPVKRKDETEESFQARKAYDDTWRPIKEKLVALFDAYKDPAANPKTLHAALIDLRNAIFEQKVNCLLMKEEIEQKQDAADFCNVILEAINYSFDLMTKTMGNHPSKGPCKSEQTSPMRILPLSITDRKKKSLDQLIKENIVENINDPKNFWYAKEKDVYLSEYTRALVIADEKPPEVMCMQLKRYGYTNTAFSIKDAFSFDKDQINLGPLIAPGSDKPILYKLVSCINHSGDSTQCGHYTSFVRKHDQWYKCNDADVKTCDTEEVKKNAEAYIFILEKIPTT